MVVLIGLGLVGTMSSMLTWNYKPYRRKNIYGSAFLSLLMGGAGIYGSILIIVRFIVKPPWHAPSKLNKQNILNPIVKGNALKWYGLKVNNPLLDYNLPYTDVKIYHHQQDYYLSAWHIKDNERQSNVCVIMTHGAARDRRAFLRHTPFIYENNIDCILFDCREHGLSSNNNLGISFGIREAEDIKLVAEYAKQTCQYKYIVLMGTSQGATSSIIAAYHLDYIDVVIAENPFSHRYTLLKEILTRKLGISLFFPKLLERFINLLIYLTYKKLNANDDIHPNAIDVIDLVKAPILLLHGTADITVNVEHSYDLYKKATQPKELWILPGGQHTALYDHQPTQYEEKIIKFIKQTIKEPIIRQ